MRILIILIRIAAVLLFVSGIRDLLLLLSMDAPEPRLEKIGIAKCLIAIVLFILTFFV